MQIKDCITGLQHLGLPVRNMELTIKFYQDLGFETAFSTTNQGDKVVFVRQKNLVIEIYEAKETAGAPGAIDHIALDVTDIEKTFAAAQTLGYRVLDTGIQYLPFWEHGVKFFTIMGPNGEKVEFSQILS